MDISRIEFFCDDRKVARALRTLTGISISNPTVQPVVNATGKGGKVAAKSSGDRLEMLAIYLKKHKLQEIDSNIMRDFLKSIGAGSDNYNYTLQQARSTGMLRKVGKGTHSKYKVVIKK